MSPSGPENPAALGNLTVQVKGPFEHSMESRQHIGNLQAIAKHLKMRTRLTIVRGVTRSDQEL